jgi:hypothetical protein
MNTEVLQLVIRAAEETNPSRRIPIDVQRGAEAPLFGTEGVLDSMALVQFIVEVETNLEDHTGTSIVLASERAMSRRRSPFGSIGSLVEYIEELLAETRTV